MKPRHAIAAARLLRNVPLFAGVPQQALEQLVLQASLRAVGVGQRVVAELETGEEAMIVLRGSGAATIGGLKGDVPVELARVRAGACIGEMALFTGELRSATVTATTRMLLLVLDRQLFTRVLRQHPSTAAHLAGVLAARFRDNQGVLATVLDPASSDGERQQALQAAGEAALSTGRPHRFWAATRVAWRELVVRHRRELPFLMMVAFALTLLTVRSTILLDRRLSPTATSLEQILRASYVSGLLLLCGTGITSLFYFRPPLRRTLAVLYGVGLALLFNALPVLLTFDLFYRDMMTRDPSLIFSVDVLWERTEGTNVALITGALLFQAVYLRRFYRRLAMLALWRGWRPAPARAAP